MSLFTNTCNLIDLRIDKNEDSKQYYIIATYFQETDTKYVKHTIKAPLIIYEDSLPVCEYSLPCIDNYLGSTNNLIVNLGFGELENATIKTEVVREKIKRMTLKEVEQALGYAIELIKEENKNGCDNNK